MGFIANIHLFFISENIKNKKQQQQQQQSKQKTVPNGP